VQLLEQQRAAGDRSEATAIALALGYAAKALIFDNENDPAGPVAGKRAAELLRPLAEKPNASVAARRAYVEVLVRVGFEQQAGNLYEDAVRTERQAMRFATDLGARNLSNLDMGAYYAEAGAWLAGALVNVGRNDEARRIGEDAVALADRVLEQRPGYRLALHAQQVIESNLAGVAQNDLNPMEAVRIGERNEQISLTLLNLDPNNITSINNLGVAHQTAGDSLWAAGRLREAIPYYLKSLDDYGRATVGGTGFVIIHSYDVAITAYRQAQIGDAAGAAATVAAGAPFLAKLRQSEPKGSMAVVIVDAMGKIPAAGTAFERDDLLAAQRIAADAMSQLQAAKPNSDLQASQKFVSLFVASHIAGRTAYQLGDYGAAERAERGALAARKAWGTQATPDQRDLGEVSTWLAMALARQGKIGEAAQMIGPVVKFQRQLATKNHGDQWLPLELACALYAESLTDTKKSVILLREAAELMNGLSSTLRPLHDVRQWRELIQQAQRSPVGRTGRATAERRAG
jgi:tetratricopeptide (TPR) repeat protein